MEIVKIRPGDRWDFRDLSIGTRVGNTVELAPETCRAIARSSDWVNELAAKPDLTYGVNTGFGALSNIRVRHGDEHELQRRHILSHACGVGNAVPNEVVRMMILIKLLTFRTGYTGVTLDVAERLVAMLNLGIHPVVPERGTVGASGDLSPLAHLALPLLGLGHVRIGGATQDGSTLARDFGLEPIELTPKDGLALTNGTQYISAVAAVETIRLDLLSKYSELIAAISAQAFSCSNRFFHPRYHVDSGNKWRAIVAENLAGYVQGGNHSQLGSAVPSMQDPYSFRCIPQVHGAAREYLDFAQQSILNEINTTSDNPLFFESEGLALFGGNLHGESVAISADVLAMVATELASISERRIYQLLSGQRGLPNFLTADPGINSGLMIAQYTAAALVSEAKTLCHPGSVDSVPTCQLQEDHVSMGGTSVLKLRQVINNLEIVLAIELMTACQAADLKPDLVLSATCADTRDRYRKVVATLADDRILSEDVELTVQFVRDESARLAEHQIDAGRVEKG